MEISILTIFPELFTNFIQASLIGKAVEKGLLKISLSNIRDFAEPPHFKVDDAPYGGGAGMLLKPEPLGLAIQASKAKHPSATVILLTPSGKPYCQSIAHSFAQASSLILVCGRYEGVDQRVIDLYVDQEISIGDYVLMGGELPAMVVIESCTRLIESAIGNDQSIACESFGPRGDSPLLEGPQYTRPAEFEGLKVPEVLLSGNHQQILNWRAERSRQITAKRRPDLANKNK